MAIFYVYITDQCREDASTHGVLDDVENLARRIEEDQSDRGLEHYPPPYRKKRMGRQGRLVIEESRFENDTVLCFVRYLIRSSAEYESFLRNTGNYHERNMISTDEVQDFLAERRTQSINRKQSLSEAELTYLQSGNAYHTDDGAYLESYDWFERISQDWAKDYLPRYYDLIVKIENGGLPEGTDTISHEGNENIKILFRNFPEHKRNFLIAPIDHRTEGDEEKLREKYSDLLSPNTPNMEALIRHSRRAYPTIIAYDENIWILVEKSIEANLALSPEEESILESVMSSASGGAKYPLFINGRPGSGKSTILQYLFADHLARYIELSKDSEDGHIPLYLTYSTPLLEQAHAAVKNILTCGAKNIEDGNLSISDTELDEILRICFRNFREFLRSLLPQGIRERNFSHANYVDFGRFRKLWDEKRCRHPDKEVRRIGAELGWHAVRTYIKGMQNESGLFVDPDCYQDELPRDTKSISDHAFKNIYEYLWEKWYEPLCRKDGHWDDQDLARAVLDHASDKLSHHPAVFCDEAQDFTAVELELIQQLSVYSKREIPGYQVKDVPFAFAGDPFQTLNPTGFNWSAMQSSFHENIVQQLDPNDEARLKFNFQELSFNYRSSEDIVKLANLIQLLRAVLLDLKGLRPQRSWTRKSIASPVWFLMNDASCEATLREQKELVIIVPCQENGELEYVKKDSFLKSMAIRDGKIVRNILSPVRAKGLEYDRVLLYGFGNDAVSRLPELVEHINNPRQNTPEIELQLEWGYFLNQFYVAVSRARKRLFIVDSNDAIKRFWSFAKPKNQGVLLDLYDDLDNWNSEELSGMIKGDDSSWSDDRDNPLELARKWQEQGHAQRDPYLLRLAKGNFEHADKPEEAQLCEAKMYEYEGEFDKAAKLFTKLRQLNDACRCYWANKDIEAITSMVEEFSEVATDPRFIAASAIGRDQNNAQQIEKVLTALEQLTPTPFPDMPGEIDVWRWFFDRFASKTADAIEASKHEKVLWKPYIDRLVETITRFELPLSAYPEIAKLFFLTGNPKSALNYWDKHCRDQNPDSVHDNWLARARAETESYPANIRSFHELGEHKIVIEQWKAAGSTIDSDTPVKPLLDSAVALGDIAVARVFLPLNADLSELSTVLSRIDQNDIRSLAGALPVAIAHSLESCSDWLQQLINFASSQTTSDSRLNEIIEKSGIRWPKVTLVASVVRVVARSERLEQEGSKIQKGVSNFLKENLIIEKDAKRDKQTSVKAVLELVEIDEAGAAFERAFRLTYVLEFYEQFFVKSYLAHHVLRPTDAQAEFAKRRWILYKRRLAKTQEGRGRDKHEDEARELEREWNISVDQEPKYPALKPISGLDISDVRQSSEITGSASDSKKEKLVKLPKSPPKVDKHMISATTTLKLRHRELTAEVLTRKMRITLTCPETQNQVTCGPNDVNSGDLKIDCVKDSTHARIWQILDWGIQCEIKSNNEGSVIRFRFADGAPILGFEFLSK